MPCGGAKRRSRPVVRYQRRRDLIWKTLTSIEGISCYKPLGAFYAFPNVEAYFGKVFQGNRIEDSSQLIGYLLDEARVAVVPGVEFGAEGYLRLSYPISPEVIQEGRKRIQEALALLD